MVLCAIDDAATDDDGTDVEGPDGMNGANGRPLAGAVRYTPGNTICSPGNAPPFNDDDEVLVDDDDDDDMGVAVAVVVFMLLFVFAAISIVLHSAKRN